MADVEINCAHFSSTDLLLTNLTVEECYANAVSVHVNCTVSLHFRQFKIAVVYRVD